MDYLIPGTSCGEKDVRVPDSPRRTRRWRVVSGGDEDVRRLESDSRLTQFEIGVHLYDRFLLDGQLRGLACRRRRRAPYVYEELVFPTSERVCASARRALAEEAVLPV